ncbi:MULTISPECIES: hypothetical protein [Methylobacterium]|uniref:hypothetical protein n=1 Tax=Methylobacterium TaxID=407 RepID=UPI001048B128|nr:MULTISPECIES: hypothetical protein [Methylobacterium]MDR7040357.1 hypothetical protein [Methylobacterium sp. BE186]
MRIFDLSTAWAQRRLQRHLARRSSGRIVRWIAVGAATPAASAEDLEEAAPGNVVAFPQRPAPREPDEETGGRAKG